MIRALFRPEPTNDRARIRLTPKVLAELGVEPLDHLRNRMAAAGTGASPARPAPGVREKRRVA